MKRQANSDPLPFIQVDRAIHPAAAMLAGHMKTTTQHAVGSLVAFWQLCGEPRALAELIENTPDGEEPSVVMTRDNIILCFKLASDHEVDPAVLVRLGLLEALPGDLYRVRGMSRYLDAVKRQVRARSMASAGGKASAAKRASAASGSSVGSAQVEKSSTEVQPTEQPEVNQDGNTDVRRQTSYLKDPAMVADAPTQSPLELVGESPKKRREPKQPDPEFAWQQWLKTLTADEKRVFQQFQDTFDCELAADYGLSKFVRKKLATHTADELCAAIRGHASDPWKKANRANLRAIFVDASVIAAAASVGANL